MTAYYNEIDEYAAKWLENLILLGHIAPGDVDTRSIEDVRPDDLRGYTQCHFFAGIGVWSYALRLAGWSDDRRVWTASCPCQPFSSAGEGAGFADERHLWPHLHHLVAECRPPEIIGEQVASKDADPWLDLVQTDMEALDYAFGAVAFPSAGVGAPHIRDRTYWAGRLADSYGGAGGQGCADVRGRLDGSNAQSRAGSGGGGVFVGLGHHHQGLEGLGRGPQATSGRQGAVRSAAAPGEFGRLANTDNSGLQRRRPGETSNGRVAARIESERLCHAERMADADGGYAGAERQQRGGKQRQQQENRGRGELAAGRKELDKHFVFDMDSGGWRGPANGYWRDADWLGCRDGKWRPVEPGTFPLAHGAANRVGRLRAYGNAINAEAARAWIEVVMECRP